MSAKLSPRLQEVAITPTVRAALIQQGVRFGDAEIIPFEPPRPPSSVEPRKLTLREASWLFIHSPLEPHGFAKRLALANDLNMTSLYSTICAMRRAERNVEAMP